MNFGDILYMTHSVDRGDWLLQNYSWLSKLQPEILNRLYICWTSWIIRYKRKQSNYCLYFEFIEAHIQVTWNLYQVLEEINEVIC